MAVQSYLKTVRERYDKPKEHTFSIPSTAQVTLDKAFYGVLRFVNDQIPLVDAKIADIGCGDGRFLRMILEATHRPGNLTGIDLSQMQLDRATQLSPSIRYLLMDITKGRLQDKQDVILVMNLFMHFGTQQEIDSAMVNIKASLRPKGVFIFYDAWAHDHFQPNGHRESWGFNPNQVIRFCEASGFRVLHKRGVFKTYLGMHHSSHLYARFGTRLTAILDLMPSPPGNFFLVFERTGSE